jgi:Fic family protein/DNA-binding Xre family transcriptional regulator
MPIYYEKLLKLFDEKGITTYYLRKNGVVGNETLRKIKKNEAHIDTRTIEKLCELLNCQPGDMMTYRGEEGGIAAMDFSGIDSLKNRLASMPSLNEAEQTRLREEFMVEHIYNANAIAGNTLTLRETALILQKGITIAEKSIKEHLDVIAFQDAFREMLLLASANEPLTEQVVKQRQSLVLMNDPNNRGVYRNIPVVLIGEEREPLQPYLVPSQMEALITDYERMKRHVHIIEAACVFHLRFEGIRPFIDANGRTGQLLLNLELIKAGLPPVDIKFVDRREYFNCFEDYHQNGQTPNALVNMIAKYDREELLKNTEILRQREDLLGTN